MSDVPVDIPIEDGFSADLLFPSRYLRSADLKGQDVTLTISDVTFRDLRRTDGSTERCAIVHFEEMQKRPEHERKVWVLSAKCNKDSIVALHGGTVKPGWIGKKVTLYPAPWRGDKFAIRVRNTVR